MAGIIPGYEFDDWVLDSFKQWIIERETAEDAGVKMPHLRRVIAFNMSSQFEGVTKVSADICVEVYNATEAVDVAKKLFVATHPGAPDPKISAREIGIKYDHGADGDRATVVVSLEGFFSADKGEEEK